MESAHIKDFMAFLRVAVNPTDGVSLRRILSLVEGVGPKGCDDITTWADGSRELLAQLKGSPARGKAKINLEPLADLLTAIMGEDTDMDFRVKAVYDYYYPKLADLYPDDWPDRQPDLQDIQRLTANREDLGNFLDEVTLDPPNQLKVGETSSENSLTLSTVHSAKGLEWKTVFILSAVEGRFPPSYAVRTAAEVEEERRLMYVAVTRAEDALYIMIPLGIVDRRTGLAAMPSRFLAALPPSAGISMGQGSRQVTINEDLNNEQDLRYNYREDSFFRPSTRIRPTSQPSPAESGLPVNPADLIDPTTITKGQRVSHPVYGPGLVTEINGPQALIDFDLFGSKKVLLPYARLTVR